MLRPGEEALVAAILADPSDNAARLVYGDWLQAQSDPRGELMVAQCRLAEGGLTPAEERKFRATEKKLAKSLEVLWAMPIAARLGFPGEAAIDRLVRVGVERGFVTSVTAPATILHRLEALFEIAPLVTEINLASVPPYDRLTKLDSSYFTSPLLARLTSLGASVPGNGDPLVRAIAACPHLANLTRFSLVGSRWASIVNDFGGDRLSRDGAHALASSPHLRGLKHLFLDEDQLEDEGIAVLAGAPWSLETLSVPNNDATGLSLEHLANAPALQSLRRLVIAGTRATTPAQIAKLAASPNLRSLVALDIERCDLGEEGLVALLAAFDFPALEELVAASNGFGEAGAAAIAKSTKLQGLRLLDLTKNAFNKKGIVAIAKSEALARVGKVLFNERDTADARNALKESAALADALVYFRGKLLAKAEVPTGAPAVPKAKAPKKSARAKAP